MKYLLFSILTIFLMSCHQKQEADLIFYNANFNTVNKDNEIVEAIAVKDKFIIATGKIDNILENYKSNKAIDLEGKYVYPGFNDGHCHFIGYAETIFRYADLSEAKSFDEIVELLKKHHSKNKANWILGRGWDQNKWDIKAFPNNKKLNNTFQDIPVVLIRVDGHAILANDAALKYAKITTNSEIEGGFIEKDNNGLTGILLENAADSMRHIIPDLTIEEKKKAVLQAQKNCLAVGLTSLTDAGLEKDDIELIQELYFENELEIRINAMISPKRETMDFYLAQGPYSDTNLTVRSLKLYADGALGSRGAKLSRDYSDDPGNSGLIVESKDYFIEKCRKAFEAGFQVNTHCIGDSASRLMLNIYSEFLEENNDLRWRIEHSQIVNPKDLNLFKKHAIIPSIQTTHATSDMFWADERLGNERIKWAYAYQDLLQQNGWLINGTDFPIEKIYPINSFYAGVVRKNTDGKPENGFQTENALSRIQALKAMTVWPAKGEFNEHIKGSIEKGMLADFVVLEKDILTIQESVIPEIKILKTYISGKEVYNINTELN